jgi:hypothetical protein
VAAYGLCPPGPVDDSSAPSETRALFEEIHAFYGGAADVPPGFPLIAHDPVYAAEVWAAARHDYADNRLTRSFKEALAFPVSVTTSPASGAAIHLGGIGHLGVGQQGVMEIVGVTQMFSSYTRIAETLQLELGAGGPAR